MENGLEGKNRMTAVITALYRYPVKGLSADALERVALAAGEALPLDRAWAIENGPSRFDPDAPRHLPPASFLTLSRDERLASLEARFAEEESRLTLLRSGRQVASGRLTERIGRQVIEQFLAAYLSASLRGPPKILSAPGHTFSDIPEKRLHIINLRSVAEIERVTGREVDPLRFRPNVVIDGPAAWSEAGWVGRELAVGSVRLRVTGRTPRCAAVNVDPKTGARDMAIPATLQREWGTMDFGVYAEVVDGGPLAVGDAVTLDGGG